MPTSKPPPAMVSVIDALMSSKESESRPTEPLLPAAEPHGAAQPAETPCAAVDAASAVLEMLLVTPSRPGEVCRRARFDRATRTIVGGGARWAPERDAPEFELAA